MVYSVLVKSESKCCYLSVVVQELPWILVCVLVQEDTKFSVFKMFVHYTTAPLYVSLMGLSLSAKDTFLYLPCTMQDPLDYCHIIGM